MASTVRTRTLTNPRIAGRAGLERVLLVAELLRQFRFGVDAVLINRETNDRHGRKWHLRTTKRDLQLLERLGVAAPIGGGRWRWIAKKPLLEMSPQDLAR